MPDISLKLTEPQERFVFSDKIYPAMIAGYGSGKSHALVIRTLMQCMGDGLHRAYLAPTYDLLRLIAFPRFQSVLDEWGVRYKLNKADAVITIENGAQVIFRTMDTPARIVGFEVADAACDELDTLKADHAADVWQKIIARCRLKKPHGAPNTCSVGTTPEGFRFVHRQWVKEKTDEHEIIRAPSSSNPTLPKGYVENLIKTYPAHLQAAYLDGEFVNMTSGSVYPCYDRSRCASAETIRANDVLHIGQDFNVMNMASIVFVNRDGKYHAVAEITGGRDTPQVIRIIKDRWPMHRIRVYPDASGQAHKTTNASVSDLSLLSSAGFTVIAGSVNPAVKNRVLSVNAALENGNVFVNSAACPETASCLEQQAYDKNGEPDKSHGKDHMNDAFGYVVNAIFPIVRPHANLRIAGA